MKVLYNTTKTMDCGRKPPRGVRTTRPRFQAEATQLMTQLCSLDRAALESTMSLSHQLAVATRADIALWGSKERPRGPALGVFTGLVFKHLDPATLDADAWRFAQKHLLILSGLYGLLRACDRIEAYRLEMGCRFKPSDAADLTAFWKPRVTAGLNTLLKRGEPVLNLGAGEYLKAVDQSTLKGPVIWPTFKERRDDGSLKVVTVHAKEARGLMTRFILENRIEKPQQLIEFYGAGWEAAHEMPERGAWLFVR